MTVKTCVLCGSAIYISGNYQKASRRKYCDKCREEVNRERSRIWQSMNRTDKRRIHEKTKAILALDEEIIFGKDEEIKLLKLKIADLERELKERGGFAKRETETVKRRRGWW